MNNKSMLPFTSKLNHGCVCCTPPFKADNYEITDIGIDNTHGRYGEVTLMKCKLCGILWINYFYENEAFSQSGRWFKGQITEAFSKTIVPFQVVAYLEHLDGYFLGGSFFRHSGAWGMGKLHL
jgi:hypothetical protein